MRWMIFLFTLLAAPALAQAPPTPQGTSVVQGNIVIAVTNTGETSALPATASAASGALTYYNSGTKDAFCTPVSAIGGVATTASLKIPAGTYLTAWNINYYSFASCITGGSDTTSVTIYQGNGPNQFGMVSGTGGSGSGVTSFNTRTGAVTLQAGDVSGVGGLLASNNLSDVANAGTSRGNLNAAKSGANSDITSITGLSTPLTVAQGGTGQGSSTGSGAVVLATSPSLVTPTLGVAAATTVNKVTITVPATGSTLTIPDGVTLNAGAGGTLGSNAFTSTAFAPLASPTFTGTPAAPTAAVSTNTTQLATTAFVIGQGYGTGNCSVSGSAGIVSNNGSNACATDTNATLSAGALSLGASGTSGSMVMGNATSGTVTLSPVSGALGNVTASFPANSGVLAEINFAQTWTATQTFATIQNSNNNGYALGTGTCVTSAATVTLEPNRNTPTAGVGCNGVTGSVSLTGGTGVVNLVVTGAANTSIFLPSITTDSTHTDSSLCQDTTTHGVYFGSGTVGICLGTSSARYKHDINPLPVGLSSILSLRPIKFHYNKGYIDSGAREQYGFLAEDVASVLPKLVTFDQQHRPNAVDILGMVPVLVSAMQTQQEEIDGLAIVVVLLFGWNIYLTVRK